MAQAGYEMAQAVTVTVKVERKHEKLPRFVLIPLGKIEPWKISGTVTVEATLNDISIGRRSLKRWDERKCFFIDLPESLCRKAGVETGDQARLSLRLAADELPVELSELLANDSKARVRWQQLTPGQRRMLREDILAAQQSSTRARRAKKALKG